MSADAHSYIIPKSQRPKQVSDDVLFPSSWSVGSVLSSVKTEYGPSHPTKKSSTRKHSNSDLALELQGLHGPFDFGSVCC